MLPCEVRLARHDEHRPVAGDEITGRFRLRMAEPKDPTLAERDRDDGAPFTMCFRLSLRGPMECPRLPSYQFRSRPFNRG